MSDVVKPDPSEADLVLEYEFDAPPANVWRAVTIPAFNSIKGGGGVNKAVADLSSTLELARTYAMANRTYVRVLFHHVPAGNGRLVSSTMALPVASADGAPGPASERRVSDRPRGSPLLFLACDPSPPILRPRSFAPTTQNGDVP